MIEWVEFFPYCFEALRGDKEVLVFVIQNFKTKLWTVLDDKDIVFATGNEKTAFSYAEFYIRNRLVT